MANKTEVLKLEEFRELVKSGELSYDGKRWHMNMKTLPGSKPKKKPKKIKPEQKIDLFCKLIKQELNLEVIREYQINPDRKWRIDYFIKELRCCIEVEGGVWSFKHGGRSRHFSGQGALNDIDKYNWLSSNNYILIRVTPDTLLTNGFKEIENLVNSKVEL